MELQPPVSPLPFTACRSQIEVYGSGPDAYVGISAGVAPGVLPKPEATDLAPKAVGVSHPALFWGLFNSVASADGGSSRAEALGPAKNCGLQDLAAEMTPDEPIISGGSASISSCDCQNLFHGVVLLHYCTNASATGRPIQHGCGLIASIRAMVAAVS